MVDKVKNVIQNHIQEFCHILDVSGSYRRGEDNDKLLEFVAVPKIEKRSLGEFVQGVEQFAQRNLLLEKCQTSKNFFQSDDKKIVLKYNELIVKIWTCELNDFGRIQAIRTGNYNFTRYKLGVAWNRLGWCSTDKGLFKKKHCVKRKGTWILIPDIKEYDKAPEFKTEQDFFKFLNIPYVVPKLRNWDFNSSDKTLSVFNYFYGYADYFYQFKTGKQLDTAVLKDFNKKMNCELSLPMFKMITEQFEYDDFIVIESNDEQIFEEIV